MRLRRGRGLEPEEVVDDALTVGLGQENTEDFKGPRGLLLLAAALDVLVEVHPGVQAEARVGNPPDERLGLGEGLAIATGLLPLAAELLGQGPELDGGERHGELALEGFDLPVDAAEGHGGSFLSVPSFRYGFPSGGEIFVFPLISAHFRSFRLFSKEQVSGGGAFVSIGSCISYQTNVLFTVL